MNDLIQVGKLYCHSGATSSDPVRYDSHLWSLEQPADGARAWMFCYRGDENKWAESSTLRVQMNVRVPVGLDTQEERTTWWYEIAQVMQMFTYGAMLGWNVFETPKLAAEYDDIIVHNHLPENECGDLPKIGKRIGLSAADLRDMTKVDVLRFAYHTYRIAGVHENSDIPGTQNHHALRIQVPDNFLLSCIVDLIEEGWLQEAGREPSYRLTPNRSSSVGTEIRNRDQIVDQRLSKIAKDNAWIDERVPTMSPVTKPLGNREFNERVFLVHGHDEAKRRELKDLLEHRFKLTPVIMMEQPGKSRTFIEKFEDEASPCTAAMAILTPDDVVTDDESERSQPRPNVLFELGWFAGHLGRDRVLLIVKDQTDILTDLLGIEQVRFKNNISESILELEREIKEWRGS